MPARKMSQSKEIRQLFYQKIKEKVQREKERLKERVEEELPSWAAWALKPLAGFFHDIQAMQNNSRGEDGETSAFLNLWLFLSKEWVLLNDVVLEPEQDEFAQIDHVLVGPPGVFLIETKAWDGAFTGYRDNWKRKQGSGWVRCSSPTKQNKRHADLFGKWLAGGFTGALPADPSGWIIPLVVFTRAKWLKVDQCSMPVFDGALSLAWHIRRRTGEKRLTVEQIDAIAAAVANARPFADGSPKIKTGFICVDAGGEEKKGSFQKLAKPGIDEAGFPGGERLQGLHQGFESPGGSNGVSGNRKTFQQSTESKFQKAGGQSKPADSVINLPGDAHRLSEKFDVKVTKDGRRFVRVRGTREEAEGVRSEVEKRGERVGAMKSDRFERGAWYFYLE